MAKMTRDIQLAVRMTRTTRDALEKAAEDEGRTMSSFMERLTIRSLQEGGYLPASSPKDEDA